MWRRRRTRHRRGARCHLDRGQPLEQVDQDDGEPVDLLGRVEAVVVVLDEATEPGAPRELRSGCGVGSGPAARFRSRRNTGPTGLVGSRTPSVSLISTTARPVSVWSSSYWRPRSIVYDATRLSSSSSRVQVGDQVRAGWLNASRNRPSGISAGAPAALRPAAVAFRHLLLDPWDKVR